MNSIDEGTLTVGLGAPGVSFTATFSLDTGEGEATWHGSPVDEWVPHHRMITRTLVLEPLDSEELPKFRAKAADIRAHGDYEYKDQFASAGISFVWSDGRGEMVEWRFHLDGGLPGGDGNATLYRSVANRVWAARDKQRADEAAREPLLPMVADDTELMPLHRQSAPWLPATEEVAKRHRLQSEQWVRASDGSQIVMIGDDAVIKFYVPFWDSTIDAEEAALNLVAYEFDFEVPRVEARGELDGWQYIAVTRVRGTPLREVVEDLSDDEAVGIARALGAAIRALHDVAVPKDSILGDVVPSWRNFLSDQRKRRHELEIARGTPPAWADRLVEHLRGWRYRKRPTNVLLHADLTYDHIMLEQVDGVWVFRGLIDFGDVKVGDPAYDFAAPFAFWTADRPDVRRAILEGYGAGEELLDRIFESLVLHEFGRLAALDLRGLESIADVRRRYLELREPAD